MFSRILQIQNQIEGKCREHQATWISDDDNRSFPRIRVTLVHGWGCIQPRVWLQWDFYTLGKMLRIPKSNIISRHADIEPLQGHPVGPYLTSCNRVLLDTNAGVHNYWMIGDHNMNIIALGKCCHEFNTRIYHDGQTNVFVTLLGSDESTAHTSRHLSCSSLN